MGFPYHPNQNQHGDECYGDGGRVVHAVRGLVSFVPLVVAIVERVSAHSSCLRGFFLLAFESTSRGLPVKRFAFKWVRAFTA